MALPAPALLAMETVVEAAAEERLVLVVGDPYDANLLTNNGFVATARLGGFAAWTTADAAALAGSPVAILAGAHERDAAHAVADALVAKRCTVRLVAPPPEAAPQFPDDTPILAWLTALAEAPEGATAAFRAQLAALVAQAPRHPGAPSRFRVLSARELTELPPLRYLVDGMLPAEALALLFGEPGAGKSFVALDLACAIATGRPFMGRPVSRRGPVLYVVAEGAAGMGQRVKAWAHLHGVAVDDIPVHFITEAARLMHAEEADHVVRAARALPDDPVLVVVDTLARCMVEGDENSTKDMGTFVDHCDRIRRAIGGVVLPVHHTRKDSDQERGAIALRGALDTMLFVRNQDGQRELVCVKQKDGAEFDPIPFDLVATPHSVVARQHVEEAETGTSDTLTPKMREALAVLEGHFLAGEGATTTKWEEATKMSASTFYHARKRLHDGGFIDVQKSRNLLTAKGRAALLQVTPTTHSNGAGAPGVGGGLSLSPFQGGERAQPPRGSVGRSNTPAPTPTGYSNSNGRKLESALEQPREPLRLELPDEPPPPDDDDAPWWTR